MSGQPSFFARLWLAIVCSFRIVFDPRFAAEVATLRDRQGPALAPTAPQSEPEGSSVMLPPGFDPHAVRLSGNVMGSPPFSGVLRHHGWKAIEVRMPAASGDPTVIAPAEVELP